MDAAPPRFRCPPEFEAVAPGVALARGGPCTELWLIRAPADFCPQSLEGCPVPLNGLERLRTGGDNDNDNDNDNDSDTKLYVLRGQPGGGDCPLLLSPVSPEGSLGCAPPLRGSLTIARSFGDAPARRKRKKAKVTAEGTVPPAGTAEGTVPPAGTVPPTGTVPPAGTAEGTVPPAGTQPGEGSGPPQVAPEEPEVATRKKKKKKHKREGQE